MTTPAAVADSSHRACALVEVVAGVEVVVPGAHGDLRPAREAGEVLEDHRDLRVGIDDRRDVEEVTGDDDEVVLGGGGRHPVELLQRVVQIAHHQDLHAR